MHAEVHIGPTPLAPKPLARLSSPTFAEQQSVRHLGASQPKLGQPPAIHGEVQIGPPSLAPKPLARLFSHFRCAAVYLTLGRGITTGAGAAACYTCRGA